MNVESSMEIRRLRSLAIEIYKTLNNLNPQYIEIAVVIFGTQSYSFGDTYIYLYTFLYLYRIKW